MSRVQALKERARLLRERRLKKSNTVPAGDQAMSDSNGDEKEKKESATGDSFDAESLWRQRGLHTA
jgi:hypothetical protein